MTKSGLEQNERTLSVRQMRGTEVCLLQVHQTNRRGDLTVSSHDRCSMLR